MTSRPPVTPIPPHRGRHAGLVSIGLLAAAIAAVWFVGDRDDPPAPTAGPAAASIALPTPAPEPPRLLPIQLGPDVETAVVTEREVPRIVTATGALTFDHSRTDYLRSPVAGVLVKTRPTSLGRTVRAGETVGVVYSLEVLAATVELLAELREFRGQVHVDRQRTRLLRFGMRREQVARIEQSMTPSAALPIIARVTGKVVIENGERRQVIEAAGDLMTITDPTRGTIYVDIPVADAALLRVGQATRVALGATTRPITAPLGYLSRAASKGRQIARVDLHPVRIATPPAEWQTVEATIELARAKVRGPAVPASAVFHRDDRTVVYVVRGEVAEPRDVVLGPATADHVVIERGVALGDRVVCR